MTLCLIRYHQGNTPKVSNGNRIQYDVAETISNLTTCERTMRIRKNILTYSKRLTIKKLL